MVRAPWAYRLADALRSGRLSPPVRSRMIFSRADRTGSWPGSVGGLVLFVGMLSFQAALAALLSILVIAKGSVTLAIQARHSSAVLSRGVFTEPQDMENLT